MTKEEFIAKYESEKPIYDAWGNFVTEAINEEVLKLPRSYKEIVKITPEPRVKETTSFVEKAFVTKKGKYKNPYDEITDKVGVRFVVLLSTDLEDLKNIIENSEHWESSKDRDFEKEKELEPRVFDYQSYHYIVRTRGTVKYKDIDIPEGIPCEVQIRTLLQHAYAEMTHDTVYKPKVRTKPTVHRIIAKSMALMETTDDLLVQARKAINEASAKYEEWAEILEGIYKNKLGDDSEDASYTKVMFIFLDMLSSLVIKHSPDELEKFLEEQGTIFNNIRTHKANFELFKNPVVLLVYFLVPKYTSSLKNLWEYDLETLHQVYSDLGISFNS